MNPYRKKNHAYFDDDEDTEKMDPALKESL